MDEVRLGRRVAVDEAASRMQTAVVDYLLAEGARAVEQSAAAVAVADCSAVGACAVAGDLATALRHAVSGVGAERALAVLAALSAAEPSTGDPAPQTVRLIFSQAASLN